MQQFNPKKTAACANGVWQDNKAPDSIAGFCFDARIIKPGECFVALTGGARDGHEFVHQALENGAGSLLLERPQAVALPQLMVKDSLAALGAIAADVRRGFSGPVNGITGSCGKTSTKEMLRILLGEGQTHATPGNWNNLIGVPMTLFGLDKNQHAFAVVEAGINQPDEMSALGAMIEADLAIITNIGPAHLEMLGSIETIALEKSQLVRYSKADAPVVLPNSAFAYPAFSKYADRAIVLAEESEVIHGKPRQVVRYTLNVSGLGSSKLTMREGAVGHDFEIASPSKGICANAALTVTAARHWGVLDTEIEKRLKTWSPDSKRGRVSKRGDQTFYIDCYNANPSSMGDALAAFYRAMPVGEPRCYVMGTMNELGANAAPLHREIGQQLAVQESDRIFFVGPEPMTRAYAEGALEAGVDTQQVESVTDAEAIQSIVANFSGNIFLKGSRSHQLEKILPKELV